SSGWKASWSFTPIRAIARTVPCAISNTAPFGASRSEAGPLSRSRKPCSPTCHISLGWAAIEVEPLPKVVATMKRISVILQRELILGTTPPTTAAEPPVGRWNTIDEKTGQARSQVEIYEQGGKYFGRITSIPQPNDSQGNPKTCSKCTGAD